jgi:hypothetical protein
MVISLLSGQQEDSSFYNSPDYSPKIISFKESWLETLVTKFLYTWHIKNVFIMGIYFVT